MRRRELLASAAAFLSVGGASVQAGSIRGVLPWRPYAGDPPTFVRPGPWLFFTFDEAQAVEAIVDRLIPPDPETPGGNDAGCAVFLDRQLAGPYGRDEGQYRGGPFQTGTKEQGDQSPLSTAQKYRTGLGSLDRHCRDAEGGHAFRDLDDARKDAVLSGIETGKIALAGIDAKSFFSLILKDTQAGFFADPIYGGNRDMAAWKMIGFPGARYDYRDWVERHNERFTLPPLSIGGASDWRPRKS